VTQTVEDAAIALRRAALADSFEMGHGSSFFDGFAARFAAGFGFLVEGLCDCGGAAEITQEQDLNVKIAGIVLYVQHIGDADFTRGLGQLSIGLNSS
jgi:hypothetical protein